MRILPRVASVAVAATVAATAVAAAASPAQASGFDQCQHGTLCLFSQPNGGGAMVAFTGSIADLRNVGLDDNVRSAWNRSGAFGDLHEGYGFTGALIIRMSPYGGAFNVQNPNASSLRM